MFTPISLKKMKQDCPIFFENSRRFEYHNVRRGFLICSEDSHPQAYPVAKIFMYTHSENRPAMRHVVSVWGDDRTEAVHKAQEIIDAITAGNLRVCPHCWRPSQVRITATYDGLRETPDQVCPHCDMPRYGDTVSATAISNNAVIPQVFKLDWMQAGQPHEFTHKFSRWVFDEVSDTWSLTPPTV